MKLIIDIPEETYDYWKEHKHEYVLSEAIANGTPVSTDGDLISREALKEKLNKKALDLANGGMIFIESINHIIDNAPTVEERQTGEWGQCYENYKNGMFYRDCSICGKATMTGDWKFCPYCGAEMKGGAE